MVRKVLAITLAKLQEKVSEQDIGVTKQKIKQQQDIGLVKTYGLSSHQRKLQVRKDVWPKRKQKLGGKNE
jgi:hypothetical protein